MDTVRRGLARASDLKNEWQGFPVPSFDDDLPLVLAHDHPLREKYIAAGFCKPAVNILVDDRPEFRFDDMPDASDREAVDEAIRQRVTAETIINSWYCRARQVQVYVFDRDGRRFSVTQARSPDRSMDRLKLWLTTIGASDAWDVDAEHAARVTLRAMLTERQWRHYDLTGTFLETSQRSRVTYVFRRSRPTIAMSPRWKDDNGPDSMRVLAVLCAHSIGYYGGTWGGCLVPSDDVITHLVWMRGDEAGFWGMANQHSNDSPEAGL